MEIDIANLKKMAEGKNNLKMTGCNNLWKDCCMAPFCDYCLNHCQVKLFRDVVQKYRDKTARTLEHHNERIKANPECKEMVSVEAVCRCFKEAVDEFEKAYNFEKELEEVSK